MSDDRNDKIREIVRTQYTRVAQRSTDEAEFADGCCESTLLQIGSPEKPSGCRNAPEASFYSERLGYSAEELAAAPGGANMGLGCGNPTAIASLKEGETVIDLGSGGGFDCFLAARQVGPTGHVVGVDMTPEMVSKARANACKGGYHNVSFRLGEIEHLPVANSIADVIISNCVINLSPDKQAVFKEAFRVLKPGGRLAISDVVANAPLPDNLLGDDDLLCGCVSGAAPMDDLAQMLSDTGFEDISIQQDEDSRTYIKDWAPGFNAEKYVVSAKIEAIKPTK